jgi:hypothetical protein
MKLFTAGGIVTVFVVVVAAFAGGEKGRARYEVARDQILARIDKLLGETEIQKKQVEIQLANARNAVSTLAAGKIKAQVRSEQVAKKIAAQEEKTQKLKDYLATLRPYLSSPVPVTIAGRNYTREEIAMLADKVVRQHKDAQEEVASLNRTKENFTAAAASLEERHHQAQQALDVMEKRVTLFEAKIDELRALKQARAMMGDENDQTLAAHFKQMEKQIDDLHANTEADLRHEERRWRTVGASNDLAEVEKLVTASKGGEATVAEIDRILGKK